MNKIDVSLLAHQRIESDGSMPQLAPDPVIDEIREVRHNLSERFDHDPKRLFDYYLERQNEHRDRLTREAARAVKEP